MKNRILWERALRLVLNITKMKRQIMDEEVFGLSPILMRSSAAVAAFIGEANEVVHPHQQLQLLSMSQSALTECIHHLGVVDDEGYGNTVKLVIEAEQVSVLLESYINALKK